MSEDSVYLEHILEAIAAIEAYVSVGRERFFTERLRQDATIRQLEIMGEATKRLSAEIRRRHPEVSWREMAALRDILIHNYMGIDLETVWLVTQEALPSTQRDVAAVLDLERQKKSPPES